MGDESFRDLSTLDGVPLTLGPQGGYHIWIAVKGENLGPIVQVRYAVLDAASDERLSIEGLNQVRDVETDTAWTVTGLAAFLACPDPTVYQGRYVKLWIQVSDDVDRQATDTKETQIATNP